LKRRASVAAKKAETAVSSPECLKALADGVFAMGLFYAVVKWASIGLAFLVPGVSFFIFSVVVLAFVIFTLMGKGERALILPVPAVDKKDLKMPRSGGK
jgi:hypothetical protein